MLTTAKRRRRGVSTVIGMSIFLLIFTMAIAYTFMWTQDFANYSDTAKEQLEFENQRNREQLAIFYDNLPIGGGNDRYITVSNPTSVVIIVAQVWNNHQLVNSTLTGVPPFSSVNITFPYTIYDDFTVVTTKGNLFYK